MWFDALDCSCKLSQVIVSEGQRNECGGRQVEGARIHTYFADVGCFDKKGLPPFLPLPSTNLITGSARLEFSSPYAMGKDNPVEASASSHNFISAMSWSSKKPRSYSSTYSSRAISGKVPPLLFHSDSTRTSASDCK